ncbi:hypothetical protein EZV62_011202 [Acer yangbiense]|uniref:RuvB-like helicase n=1 Tax=Acer yangbiense TaxID=1000413 RepID=A0A5C7I5F2_9ROSI|nr:hypothetical protein EZV62_011202 [Acer yangbiense]
MVLCSWCDFRLWCCVLGAISGYGVVFLVGGLTGVIDGENTKQAMERRFDERIDIGSNYHIDGSLEETGGSCPSSSGEVSSKGVRGPIDRFFQSKGNDNEHGKGHNVPLPLKDAKEASKLVTMDVGRFFFENGIPFNVAVSTSFASMCRSIGDYGQGYKVPSPHDLSTWVLKKEVETMEKIVDDVKKTCKTTGVTQIAELDKETKMDKMKIEEVQSAAKKQRIAAHTHIKGLGLEVPFCPMVDLEVYSSEVKKTEVLMENFRRAIGLCMKENKEVYEGEVTELSPEETESVTGGYGGGWVWFGDVIYIEANSGAVKRVGRSDAFATEFDLEAEEYVPLPKGEVHKKKERVQVVNRYIDECVAELVPGVLFIDEILAIRAQVEELVVDEDSLACLGEIARDTSLRHAVQLLSPASVVAKMNDRDNICKEDVEEVKALYLDAKSSARLLQEQQEKYIT